MYSSSLRQEFFIPAESKTLGLSTTVLLTGYCKVFSSQYECALRNLLPSFLFGLVFNQF